MGFVTNGKKKKKWGAVCELWGKSPPTPPPPKKKERERERERKEEESNKNHPHSHKIDFYIPNQQFKSILLRSDGYNSHLG
jgi:hypothetical protein